MPGETDVVNVALVHIGATPIVSLGDGTPSANAADDVYVEIRDGLLRGHPWNFATTRVKLAQSSTVPAFEFDLAYPLPSDWLRTISVHDNDAGHGTLLYRTELIGTQRAIITNADAVYLRYVKRIADPNLMHSDFLVAFEYALAQALAIKLANSTTLREEMSGELRRAKATARSSDALDSPPESRPRGSWASARGGRRHTDILDH